jgi:hypothetical protein
MLFDLYMWDVCTRTPLCCCCMDADAWTLMVLVYLFVAVNQEPELYIRFVITLINVMKLCKGILSRVNAEYGQGLDHVPCMISLLYAELDLLGSCR